MNRNEQCSVKGGNSSETRRIQHLAEGLDEASRTLSKHRAARGERIRAGDSSSPGFVSEFNSSFVRRETRATRDDTLKHSTLNLFPLGRSLLQLRVFLLVSVSLFPWAAESLVSLNYRY